VDPLNFFGFYRVHKPTLGYLISQIFRIANYTQDEIFNKKLFPARKYTSAKIFVKELISA
jgi:hypothetical protein